MLPNFGDVDIQDDAQEFLLYLLDKMDEADEKDITIPNTVLCCRGGSQSRETSAMSQQCQGKSKPQKLVCTLVWPPARSIYSDGTRVSKEDCMGDKPPHCTCAQISQPCRQNCLWRSAKHPLKRRRVGLSPLTVFANWRRRTSTNPSNQGITSSRRGTQSAVHHSHPFLLLRLHTQPPGRP